MRWHQTFPLRSSPLGIVSPDIGSVTDVLMPLIGFDQDNADANGEA